MFPLTSDLTQAYFRHVTHPHTRPHLTVQPNVNFVLCPGAIMSSLARRRPLNQAWIGKQEVDPDEI